MSHLATWLIFAFLSIVVNLSEQLQVVKSSPDITDLNKNPKSCVKERFHKMDGYICARLELRGIPTDLESSTRVLNLSENRIRDLTRQSFASLIDLQFLYLYSNMINHIEDDTFAILAKLEVLDLSGNALVEVPQEIFNLPLLRNLYLANNFFGDHGFETLKSIPKPIIAPLENLSIAYTLITMIPDFGILPKLWQLDISSNPIRELTPQQFSPFCHLKEIELSDMTMEKCRCEEVTRFLLKKRGVYLLSSNSCGVISSECNMDEVSFNETEDYAECLSLLSGAKIVNTEFNTDVISEKVGIPMWGYVAIGVLFLILGVAGFLYFRN